MKFFLFLFLHVIFYAGCVGNYLKELPGGYQLASEDNINTIIAGKDITISCMVKDYKYNEKFIVASQIYYSSNKGCITPTLDYNQIDEKLYYWIIDIKNDKLFGPFKNKNEFIKNKKELGINLKL